MKGTLMHSKKRLVALLLAASLIVLLSCSAAGEVFPASAPGRDELRVTFIDVGKGDCILIEKGSSAVLIDAGYSDTAPEVIAFLQNRELTALDCMIITHYDKDHVGGASQIAEAFPIGEIYLPDYEPDSVHFENLMNVIAERKLNARCVTEDVSFVLEDTAYSIYASELTYDPEDGNDNDVSLVVSAEYGGDSFLFPGDLEKKGIKAFLAAEHGTFDVVKMPHHGKKEKNSDDFLDSTAPKIAVITDSEDRPAEDDLLDLLDSAGAEIFRTAENGTIVITGCGTGEYRTETAR